MADKASFVREARAQGVPDDKIAAYLAKRTGSEDFLTSASASGAKPSQLVDFLVNKPDAQDETPAAPLKDTGGTSEALGFVNGGAKVFNNMLGAGSTALQKVGVPADVVHNVGKLIRSGPVGAFTGQHLPNKDELAALNANGARAGYAPGKIGTAAGEIAGTVPAAVASAGLAPEALGLDGLAETAPWAARGLNALSGKGLAGGVIQGAEQGLQTTDHTDAGGILQDATVGGGFGGAGELVNKGIGAFVAPRFSGAMNTLLDMGQKKFSLAELTGNQQIKKVEDAVRSSPILGGLVEGSQNGAEQDFNRAYLQKAADTAGLTTAGNPVKIAGKPTQDTYGELATGFGNRLKDLYSNAAINSDAALRSSGHASTIDNVLQEADPALAQKVNGLFTPQGKFNPATSQFQFSHPPLKGQDIQAVDQHLADKYDELMNPGAGQRVSVAAKAAASKISDARQALHDALERQQPDIAKGLNDTNQGYAMFKRAQEASTGANGKVDPGLFTPQALKNATYKAVGPNARATLGSRGDIPGQDIVDAGTKVMGSRVADSGTGFRVAVNRLLDTNAGGRAAQAGETGFGLAAAHGALANPLTAAAAAAVYGSYLPGVRDAITNTVVGNSKNKLLVAARKALDEQAKQNIARNVTTTAAKEALTPEPVQ